MGYIRVYNDTHSPVILHGLNRDYTVAPANEVRSGSEDLPEEDVLYIASKSSVFERGTLRFEDGVMEQMMEKLRKPNWRKTYVTQADIEDVILHPTYENMMQVVAITSNTMIERYRGVLVQLQNKGQYGVSERVERVIRQRWEELRGGRVQSRITFPPDYFKVAAPAPDPKYEAMAAKQATLEAELERLRAELAATKAAPKTVESATAAAKPAPKPTRKQAPKKAE